MLGAICHGLLKNLHVPAEDRTGDPSISSPALYHVAIKAGLYRKAVQVYYIPNLYPVTYIIIKNKKIGKNRCLVFLNDFDLLCSVILSL